ncbi:MAG: J domain-containing protein [Synechococcales cyanobacterium T60_A2020_003]|nr:J domain-containing protein [Synechococcales cyanobacterium T60_A2020_003]
MVFKLEQGLFGLDFTDHHAVLGVSVDADIKEIRKRYLKIARRLHPDSSALKDDGDRQRAHELLSKLVNPSYEFLSQEKNFAEQMILLKIKGEEAQRQQETIMLTSDRARQLASSPNLEHLYTTSLADLTESQYDDLDQMLTVIGQVSELNLVYLMRRGSTGTAPTPKAASANSTAPIASPSAKNPTVPSRDELVDSFIRRSEGFEKKRDYAKAILELREALKIKPTNADCHSRLGAIYLKTKQPTMAKIYFSKALELNPQDDIAKAGLRSLDPNAASPSKQSDPRAKASDSKPGGGLFGLFGGKKK